MIVLGEVPPTQPEQEQESAQDVAAQWLQSEEQKAAMSTAGSSGILTAASRSRQDMPPIPQPRQRITKERPDIRILTSNRNRKSRRRRITVAGNHFIHHSHNEYKEKIQLQQALYNCIH
jgi:hypothetical protein